MLNIALAPIELGCCRETKPLIQHRVCIFQKHISYFKQPKNSNQIAHQNAYYREDAEPYPKYHHFTTFTLELSLKFHDFTTTFFNRFLTVLANLATRSAKELILRKPSLTHCLLFVISLYVSLNANANNITDKTKNTTHTEFNEHYINVPLGDIYLRTEGSGHPIIFINGGPGAGHSVFLGWFNFLKSQGYQLVFFDDIGRGRSTRKISEPFTPQMTVNDIESVRQYLNTDKVILVAHSYGGIPAMQYALQHQEHVEKLVMLNASYDSQSQQMNADHYFYLIRTLYPEKWEQLEAMNAQGIKASDPAYDSQLFGSFIDWYQWYDVTNRKHLRKYSPRDKRDSFNLQVFMDIIDLAHGGEIQGTLTGIDISEQTKHFNIPTLITAGRFDNASTPQLVKRLYKMLPKTLTSFEMFEKSGHWPWVEETKRFEAVLSEFLNTPYVQPK